MIDGQKRWITIGFGDVVQTIIVKESDGFGYELVKNGDFFEFVSEVNQQLMVQDLNQ